MNYHHRYNYERLERVELLTKVYGWIFVLSLIALSVKERTPLFWATYFFGGLVCYLLLKIRSDIVEFELGVSALIAESGERLRNELYQIPKRD